MSRSASTAVLASQLPIYDDYGHRLWLITDPSEMDWERDWRYLDQTVNEVAQTVRLPLMAAGSLIKRAERALDEEFRVRTMLDAALRQIGKADITYERLSNTLTVRNGPDRQPELLDVVQALRQAIAALPEEDIDACDRGALDISKAPFRVVGWPEQLGFAFRSVLGYLLVRRPLSGKVRIEVLQEDGSGLCLRFSVCGARPEFAHSRRGGRLDRCGAGARARDSGVERRGHRRGRTAARRNVHDPRSRRRDGDDVNSFSGDRSQDGGSRAMTRFLPATAALELQKAEMSEVYIAVEDAFGKDATIELIGTYAEAVRMAPAFRKPDADTVLLLDARLPPNAQTSYDGEQSAALAILGQRLNGAPATIVLTPKLVIDEIVDFCRPGSGAIALPLHRLNASTLGGFVKMLLPTPQPTWNVIEIEVSERSTKCILVTRNGGQMEWNEGRPASSRAVQRMSMKYKTPKFAVGWARQFHDDGFTLFTELVRDTLGSGFYRHLASAAGGLENLAFRFRVDDLRLYSAPFEAAVWPSDQPFSGTENDFADNPFVLVNAPIARRMKRVPIRRTTAFDTLPPRPRLLFVSSQVGANPAAPTGVDTVGVQEIDPETAESPRCTGSSGDLTTSITNLRHCAI